MIFIRIKLKFSDEEQAEHFRIGKEYNKRTFAEHNKFQHDLANKIWLQQESIRALPEKLREAAKILDESEPPAHRPWPIFATPPIKDFDIDVYAPRERNAGSNTRNATSK
jgi:hypothetical protein